MKRKSLKCFILLLMILLMINEIREKIYDKLNTLISVAEVFD